SYGNKQRACGACGHVTAEDAKIIPSTPASTVAPMGVVGSLAFQTPTAMFTPVRTPKKLRRKPLTLKNCRETAPIVYVRSEGRQQPPKPKDLMLGRAPPTKAQDFTQQRSLDAAQFLSHVVHDFSYANSPLAPSPQRELGRSVYLRARRRPSHQPNPLASIQLHALTHTRSPLRWLLRFRRSAPPGSRVHFSDDLHSPSFPQAVAGMDLLDEHDSGDTQERGASYGDSRFRHKKSKVWAEYKPVYVNGVLRAECRRCHVHVSCRGGHFGRHYKICKAKEGQQPQDDGLQYGVEPFYEYNNDDIQAGVVSDGDSEFRNMKSKLWDEYKPIFVNGVIRKGECRYCHLHLSCFGGQFWRHHKICRAKRIWVRACGNWMQTLDMILPDSLDDTNLVTLSENRKACSTIWKDNVGGRNDGAEYVRSHQRLGAGNETVSHLNQHNQPCQVRGGTIINDQKSVFLHSSVPSSKSRLQDELSSVLANGKVQNPDCVSKFLKGSSGKRIPVERHIPPSPPLEKMDRKDQSTSSAQSMLDTSRKFDQEASC
ncbi:hypothetical protein EJB05_09510, partial [Eragrostis curvula]